MTDTVLLKFRKINKHLLESLVRSEIYFARTDRLNDPFDCKVDILKALERAILKLYGNSPPPQWKTQSLVDFFKEVQTGLATFGVCSFSLDELENPVLWSHYADEHRGLCLAYSFPESFIEDSVDQSLGIEKVVYEANPLTDWLIQEVPDFVSYEQFFPDMIMKVLSVKAKKWEYENEVRIIRSAYGALALDKRFLKQVRFGLETPEPDISLVRDLLANSGYEVVPCRIVRSPDSDFGIDVNGM